MFDLNQPWHRHPAALACIAAMHNLTAIAEALRPHLEAIAQHDPAQIVGRLEIEEQHGDGFNRWSKWYADGGGSAVEGCLDSLNDLRDNWIDERLQSEIRAKQWPARYSGGDEDPAAEFYDELLRDTPTVDDAINEWRRQQTLALAEAA